jgi:hypothetical protein
MKKFSCVYTDAKGFSVGESPSDTIEAASAEEAAHTYAEQHPSDHPKILVNWGVIGQKVVDNPLTLTQVRLEKRKLRVKERLMVLHQQIGLPGGKSGRLVDLSYDDLCDLIENMWDFPEIRDELSPEDCAVREKLYKIAFFDRDLQAGLQTSLLNQIASGQPTAGVASSGQSNLTRNAAMLAGGAVALQKLTQIEENTGDVSEGLGFD